LSAAVAFVSRRFPGVFRVRFTNRHGKHQWSRTYFIRYTARGKQIRESTGKTSEEEAWQIRLQRLHELGQGIVPNPGAGKLTAANLRHLVYADLDARGKVTAGRVDEWLAPVVDYFGTRPMIEVVPADLVAYVSHRKKQGIAPGSVSVELAWLRRGFRLAVASNLLPRAPQFPKIEFDNARRVFADWPVVERLLPHLPPYLRPVVLTAHFTGWRKESILTRERALHLDLEGRWLYLERQANKGRAPVRVWLNDALLEALRGQDALAREIERRTGRMVPWVFFYYEDAPQRQRGDRIRTFNRPWDEARRAAGMPELRFHDLRRGAIRDLRRDGSTEHEVMVWTGLKSRTVFERYDIVDEERLREVGERQQRRHAERAQGKVADIARKP
jgi:integrase